jgi:outer membrane protein OmpA-like peptidoglycan-associated protein
MKKLFTLFVACFCFFAPVNNLQAQTVVDTRQGIELTPDELKQVIRKMAEFRRQRVLMWQRQQMLARQRALNRKKAAETYSAEPRVIIREDESGRTDTVVNVVETTPVENKMARTVDNSAELASLSRRLDRQEELLLDLLDRPLAVSTPPAPARSDTIIQQIMLNQRDDQGATLSKEDLQALTTEVTRMNIELNNLRRQLAEEEDRRRRAELETERARSRNDGYESLESERLRYERDQNRARWEEERLRAANPVAPVVIENEAPVRIVRDTVYVDRVRTTPVFIPKEGRTDTVIVVRETVRETAPTVIRDTIRVEREREVVRTDTLQLRAAEPISFPAIFFDNNSSQLNAAHRNLIAGVVDQLKGKTNYTIRLTGFASPSGNAAYNQQLSAKRAAAVRRGFENLGMNGDRIVIVPGGIDFQPTNAAAARRVEVQALPR